LAASIIGTMPPDRPGRRIAASPDRRIAGSPDRRAARAAGPKYGTPSRAALTQRIARAI